MSHGEIFSPARIERCFRIATTIFEYWRSRRRRTYIIRATEAVSGLPICELHKQYFSIGVDPQNLSDLLVVFSIVEQWAEILRRVQDFSADEMREVIEVATKFSDAETARILSRLRVETPFDRQPHLKLV